jgi:predicted Zn-dependent protease with MMP-like domain
VFEGLPDLFRRNIDNVHIAVEDLPPEGVGRRRGVRNGGVLLGLYEGVPLTRRGSWYGMAPVLPDRITLYKGNLEAFSRTGEELRENIRDTLIHEIGHYYGMTERQIRAAGY